MLTKILWVAVLALAAFIVTGVLLPAQHQVERSIVIERPVSVVFSLLNSYASFNQWSPWAERDPEARYTLSGPEAGVGARLAWDGDPRLVGSGWQEITASRPYERIEMTLDFGDQGVAQSYYALEDVNGASHLSWGFTTDVTAGKGWFGALMGKYFGLFLEQWVGADYEQGLATLKRYAESLPEADFASANIAIVEVAPVDVLMVSASSSQQADDVARALAEAFGEITRYMTANDIEIAGQPMAITRAWDEQGYRFDAALPVDRLPESVNGRIRAGQSPGGRAIRIIHRGPYDEMLGSYDALASYMAAHGLREGAVSWEHYISDPGDTAPEDLVTHIYIQLADPAQSPG
jgi:effector-binding domain-containing protein